MIIILDASAVINGLPVQYLEAKQITTSAVLDEVKSKKGKAILELALDLDRIEIYAPKKDYVEEVVRSVKEVSDNLSKNDIDLLALALEYNASVATDDYGIQNIAKKLGIEYITVQEAGIKEVFHWQYYCPGCRKVYEKAGTCGVCGTELKRKRR